MMVIADKSRVSGNGDKIFPIVESFDDSKTFYEPSPQFKQAHKTIRFVPGFKCSQCEHKSKHNFQSGYCFIHKRIVDMGETCAHNSRSEYRNVNTPVKRYTPQPLKEVYTPITEW
jgi:hypothetical protein